MFENSVLNKLEVFCQFHPRNRVSTICLDHQCMSCPLLCANCLNQFDYKGKHLYHQSSLKGIWDGLTDIASLIEKDRPVMDKLFKQIVGKKENEELIRWQQQYERHAHSFENHINSIKYQLEEEVKGMYRLFEVAIQDAKENAFKELDRYYRTYRDNFDIFSKLIQPLISYNTSHKYYSNFNNIALKLFTQPKKKAAEWVVDLKNTLTFTQKISQSPASFEELLERATNYMNAMIDALPTIDIKEEKTTKVIHSAVAEMMKNAMQICDLKSLNLILSSVQQGAATTNGANASVLEDRRNIGGKKIFEEKALARKSSR